MAGQGASYGLQYHSRAIAAQQSELGRSCWLVGTTVIAEENEIQLLQLDAEKDRLTCVQSFTHPPEVWSIVPNPHKASQLATTFTAGQSGSASIWSLPEEGRDLIEEAQLSGDVKGLAWSPLDESSVASVSGQGLMVWKIHNGKAQVWDLRSMTVANDVEGAHGGTVRCLDFASGSSNCLASCGDDCRVKVWDVRSLKQCLVSFSDHDHWVWQCKFSPTHEQLLLTSSSDATVHLQHLPRLAKQGSNNASASPNGARQRQGFETSCAAVYDGHDNSVYGVAWSVCDPWTFASVSYDGRVIVSRVPSNVKYSILI